MEIRAPDWVDSLSLSLSLSLALAATQLSCTADVPRAVDGRTTMLRSPSDHRWAFDRADPPEPVRNATQRAALSDLSALYDRLEGRSGRAFPEGWQFATDGELAMAMGLLREGAVVTDRESWREDLAAARASAVPPDAAQEAAIEAFGRNGAPSGRVDWYDAMGAPGRLRHLGFARRGRSARGVVEAWLSSRSGELASILAAGGRESWVLDDVVASADGNLDIARHHQEYDGVVIDGHYLFASVTTAASPVGPGILWEVQVRALPDLDGRMAHANARIHLSAVDARDVARAAPGSLAELTYDCGERCQPIWRVTVDHTQVAVVDAHDGALLARRDPRHHGGPIYLGSYPPGASSLTPVLFRGANVFDGFYADLDDATYTVAGSAPYWVMQAGPMPTTGAWPVARVDWRRLTSWNDLEGGVVAWNPATQPNRNFGNPDAWPSNIYMDHMAEITYGWLSYWQRLIFDGIGQVPDTLSFQLGSDGNPTGVGIRGCQTGVSNNAPPGSGQGSWGTLGCTVGGGDDVNIPIQDLGLVAHEFGHTVAKCAATAGAACGESNPGAGVTRPSASLWRRNVWSAAVENMANMYSAILAELRNPVYGGYGGPATDTYRADWIYDGYFSTTDDFGSATQDSAGVFGDLDCNTAPCPTGYSCVSPTDESPNAPSAGICALTCTSTAGCQSGLYCTPLGGNNVCWHNDYVNAWFSTVGSRLALDAGWRDGLHLFNLAHAGNSNNGTRDFAIGGDNWYANLQAAGPTLAFETSRAVRSASTEPGVPIYDDFTARADHAIPITVIDDVGTPIWWGHGAAQYPTFDHALDVEYVLFRGHAGASYEVTAQPVMGSTADLQISVRRWNNSYSLIVTGSGPSGQSATVDTGGLPATDWYVVAFTNRALGTGEWMGNIRLSSGSDDFLNNQANAYPVPHGVPTSGHLSKGDSDRFQIYVPKRSSSLVISTTGSPAPAIEVFAPNGVSYATGVGSLTVPSVPSVGDWRFRIYDTTKVVARDYTVTATLGCADSGAGSCDNLPLTPPRPARYSWGDHYAGRLPATTSAVEYSIELAAGQHATFGLVDNSIGTCRLQLDLYPPDDMAFFQSQYAQRWLDLPLSGGAAAGDPIGDRLGAGGHVVAMVPGTYRVRVSSSNAGTDCHYRLFMAKSNLTGEQMPSW